MRFLSLQQAACGKPESQFEAATPPDWGAVETGALQLLARSRDLRLVVLWAEARLNLGGLQTLPESLGALASLLETAWAVVNPPLDDGDPYARINVIEGLGFGGTFFQSLRNCVVVENPRIGVIRLKDFEALAGHLPGTELSVSREQIELFFHSPESKADTLRAWVLRGQFSLKKFSPRWPCMLKLIDCRNFLNSVCCWATCCPVCPHIKWNKFPRQNHTVLCAIQSTIQASWGIQLRSCAFIPVRRLWLPLIRCAPTSSRLSPPTRRSFS